MKKILIFGIILMCTNMVLAQENIPLFDEEPAQNPKIGRSAEPLNSLILTPEPLPEVEVELNTTPKQEIKLTTPVAEKKEEQPPKNITRSEPISLKKDMGVVKIKRIEKKESKPAPVAVSQPVEPAENTTIQSADDIENLFGKVHDVHLFEIAGVSLGMTPDEVIDAMKSMGYKRIKTRYGIPMFRTSFYEQNCRDKKISLLNEIRRCIENQADSDDVKYIASMTFARPASKEYMRVLFSSNATDNVVYKIYYESEGDNSLTLTQRNLAKQLRRKDMFWNMMFETYGLPDDSELILWGDPQKAYMQATMNGSAYNAYIVMEDKEIQDTDYFSAEDDSKDLQYKVPFSFAGEAEME